MYFYKYPPPLNPHPLGVLTMKKGWDYLEDGVHQFGPSWLINTMIISHRIHVWYIC